MRRFFFACCSPVLSRRIARQQFIQPSCRRERNGKKRLITLVMSRALRYFDTERFWLR
ncbi:hypothetical protein ACFOGG_17500 [Brenneria rubrifaciens]|uniref:hypothetical protein n=1 Tax=Brenneria rubrifaciens TaxID=55213 RepID=UPI003609A562